MGTQTQYYLTRIAEIKKSLNYAELGLVDGGIDAGMACLCVCEEQIATLIQDMDSRIKR